MMAVLMVNICGTIFINNKSNQKLNYMKILIKTFAVLLISG